MMRGSEIEGGFGTICNVVMIKHYYSSWNGIDIFTKPRTSLVGE